MKLPFFRSAPPKSAQLRWDAIVESALPMPALAFVAASLLEGPSGQSSPFDSFVYPFMAAALLAVDLLFIRKRVTLGFATMSAAWGASFFFAAKLFYILFLYPNPQFILNEMTESLFWVPAVYVLAAFVPGMPGARWLTRGFFGVFTLTSLAYLVTTWQQPNYSVLYALLQLNLANLTCAVLVLSFNALRRDFEKTAAKAEVLELRAATDTLTGLSNRPHFERVLKEALRVAAAKDERLAVAFIDLDSFKSINDSLGHGAGDQLLRQVGRVLAGQVRAGDTVARLGGDEFVLLLRDLGEVRAGLNRVERLGELLRQPFHLEGQWQRTSVSIGVSFFPDDGDDLLRNADSAMYEAKRSGKNAVRRFDEKMTRQRSASQHLAQDLRAALERGELSLVYQPVTDLHTGEFVSVEALLRWNHPQGAVPPDTFIPLAEEHGLILPLGTWVLEAACEQLRNWHRAGFTALRVNVNVSAFQFAQPDFVTLVRETLARHGLSGSSLEIELTESVLLTGPVADHATGHAAVNAALTQLRGLGVSVALDDFGTGYSSLAYLNHLAIDTVKIDRSFVTELSTTPSTAQDPQFSVALVQAVVAVAAALDLKIVAEGIETAAQRDLLRSLGCQRGQGYFFARPLAPDDVTACLGRARVGAPSPQLAVLN